MFEKNRRFYFTSHILTDFLMIRDLLLNVSPCKCRTGDFCLILSVSSVDFQDINSYALAWTWLHGHKDSPWAPKTPKQPQGRFSKGRKTAVCWLLNAIKLWHPQNWKALSSFWDSYKGTVLILKLLKVIFI